MHSRAAMKGSVVEVKRSSNNFSDRVVSRHVALLFRHSGRRSGHHRPEGIDFAGLAKQPSPKPSKAQGACCARDHEQRRRVRAAFPHPGWRGAKRQRLLRSCGLVRDGSAACHGRAGRGLLTSLKEARAQNYNKSTESGSRAVSEAARVHDRSMKACRRARPRSQIKTPPPTKIPTTGHVSGVPSVSTSSRQTECHNCDETSGPVKKVPQPLDHGFRPLSFTPAPLGATPPISLPSQDLVLSQHDCLILVHFQRHVGGAVPGVRIGSAAAPGPPVEMTDRVPDDSWDPDCQPQCRGVSRWHGDAHGDADARRAVYNNRVRLRSGVGKQAMRNRAEPVERSFAKRGPAWSAPDVGAGSRECPQALSDPCGRAQSRAAHAPANRGRNPERRRGARLVSSGPDPDPR